MKHLIEINDESDTGKSLIHLLKNLAKSDHSVCFVESIAEEIEDDQLLKMMAEANNTGDVDEKEIFKTISEIIKK